MQDIYRQQMKVWAYFKNFFVFKVLQLLGDVTKKEVCEELVDKTLNHFGELDVLVRWLKIFSIVNLNGKSKNDEWVSVSGASGVRNRSKHK